jgi:hypothetical protein
LFFFTFKEVFRRTKKRRRREEEEEEEEGIFIRLL